MPEYDVTIYLKPVTVTADDPGQAVGKAADQVKANVLGEAASLAVEAKTNHKAGFRPGES